MDVKQSDLGGQDAGSVAIFHGPSPGALVNAAQADATLVGEAAWNFAHEVILPGDVDGDGTGDVVVGSHAGCVHGRVYLYLGPLSGVLGLGSADVIFDADHQQAPRRRTRGLRGRDDHPKVRITDPNQQSHGTA